MAGNILERPKLVGPVQGAVVSDDRGLLCIDIEVSSRCMELHGYEEAVELRSGHVDRQNSHQKLKDRVVFSF